MKRKEFLGLNIFEGALWLGSVTVILSTFLLGGSSDIIALVASLIGATALIYVAKGLPVGQILTVMFALVYGYISLKFHYYGEMITYLGMTSPIAVAATVSWFRNPYEAGRGEVKVRPMRRKDWGVLILLTAGATAFFGMILAWLSTSNLFWSTVSVATSFLASALTLLRSPYYALAYGANDVVLIILWIFASMENSGYIPMIICFVIFLINDCYGFIHWSKMSREQRINHKDEKMFEKTETNS